MRTPSSVATEENTPENLRNQDRFFTWASIAYGARLDEGKKKTVAGGKV